MASKLLSDLEAIQRFLQEQRTALGGAAEAVQGGQHESICVRLTSLTLTVDEAAQVSKVIGTGPWTDPERQRLLELVTSCLKGDAGL